MSLFSILIVLVIVALIIGGLPGNGWGYGQHVAFGGGYGVPGVLVVVLVVVLVLILMGRL